MTFLAIVPWACESLSFATIDLICRLHNVWFLSLKEATNEDAVPIQAP